MARKRRGTTGAKGRQSHPAALHPDLAATLAPQETGERPSRRRVRETKRAVQDEIDAFLASEEERQQQKQEKQENDGAGNGRVKREAVMDRLRQLKKAGLLTPERVVEDARNPSSPLHSLFEWDDTKAAHAYRLAQARRLMTVRILTVRNEVEIRVPAYVRDPRAKGHEQGYRETIQVASDEDRSREVLVNEIGAIAARLERLKALAAAFDLQDEVEALLEQLGLFKERVEEYA